MTVAELMHHNFDEIFIELDPVKREAMIHDAYKEDCVWIHPGGRLVGIAAINEAASEIRKRIPEYRYKVVGDIRTMHNVGMCRWGSGLPDQPFRYTGTDVLEERDGRVAVFYTFIDSGTPPVSPTESGLPLDGKRGRPRAVAPLDSCRTAVAKPACLNARAGKHTASCHPRWFLPS